MQPIPAMRQHLPQPPAACANPGLELDRYVPTLGDKSKGKNAVLGRIVAAGVPPSYADAFDVREQTLKQLDGIRLMKLHVTGRMIVGLATASVLETGITLSRAWGMPYVPGSALKGLASHTVTQRLGLVPALKAQREGRPLPPMTGDQPAHLHAHTILFGTTTDAGYITWHDAWWIPDRKHPGKGPFRRDVMTVHHQEYYRNRGQHDAAPTDFDDPNPVSFLSVAGDFLVAIQAPDTVWGERVEEILRFAFQHQGAGGKTSSGYGRGELTFLHPQVIAHHEQEEPDEQDAPQKPEPNLTIAAPVTAVQAQPVSPPTPPEERLPKGLNKNNAAKKMWDRAMAANTPDKIRSQLTQWRDELEKLAPETAAPIAVLMVHRMKKHDGLFDLLVHGGDGKASNAAAVAIARVAGAIESAPDTTGAPS